VTTPANPPADRVDTWLWAIRVKTRSLAGSACRAGSVSVNQLVAKPARGLQPGDVVTARQGLVTRTLRVRAIPRARVGAATVGQYCEDLTPPEEFEKARTQRVQQLLAREKGSGRPTKKDRRRLDDLFH
jgi:ribosome-associated heat shock protein Hsp15